MPSDHLLSVESFKKSLAVANTLVETRVVTFGVCPTYPETGYGYIVEGDNHTIEKFIEKPPLDVATQLMTNPNCYWNQGVFYFQSDVLMNEFSTLCPNLLGMIKMVNQTTDEYGFVHYDINKDEYQLCPNIPFDKLIMEKTHRGSVVSFSGLWSDIGSWEAIFKLKQQPSSNCAEVDTKNCHIYNANPPQAVAVIGLDDICIVNTKDAILISKLSDTQKVKNIMPLLDDKYK
jgi:mannose-1-phosphate guanylyltransferase